MSSWLDFELLAKFAGKLLARTPQEGKKGRRLISSVVAATQFWDGLHQVLEPTRVRQARTDADERPHAEPSGGDGSAFVFASVESAQRGLDQPRVGEARRDDGSLTRPYDEGRAKSDEVPGNGCDRGHDVAAQGLQGLLGAVK